jgi:hypothetical protein
MGFISALTEFVAAAANLHPDHRVWFDELAEVEHPRGHYRKPGPSWRHAGAHGVRRGVSGDLPGFSQVAAGSVVGAAAVIGAGSSEPPRSSTSVETTLSEESSLTSTTSAGVQAHVDLVG